MLKSLRIKPVCLMAYKILFTCFILCACSTSRMIGTELYFGQTRPDGSMITEAEWNHFKESQVFRVFTKGSTTIKVTGSWLDPVTQKLISEPTYVVSCFYKRSTKISRQIDSLRNIYKTMFDQQSILRVDKKVKARF